jgi:hypothetical protein
MPESDLRELLVAEAARQRPAAAPPYAALAGRAAARRRNRGATLAALVASVAAAAIVVPMIVIGVRDVPPTTGGGAASASGSPVRSGADPLVSTFSGPGITFRYPAVWRAQQYTEVSSFSILITYLSTDGMHDPCATHASSVGEEVDCNGPIGRLGADGVLVTWFSFGMPDTALTAANTTVGGHPASVHSGPADDTCAKIGGTRTVDAQIAQNKTLAPQGRGEELTEMSACIAGSDTARAEADVTAMLDSVQFWS